jgi:hypothetical protein
MRKKSNKQPNRVLSEMYLDKISEILRDRWKETQQAIQLRMKEKNNLNES